jgi:hypothetical protein
VNRPETKRLGLSLRRVILVCAMSAFVSLTASPKQQRPNAATEGALVGTVADKVENAPIPHAFVYVHGGPRKADSVPPVDGLGRFQVSLAPGLYDVFVASPGFLPTCVVVSIESGKTTKYEPRLGADNEHLQQ